MNPSFPGNDPPPQLSDHSRRRMAQRGIGPSDVLAAMDYGRKQYVRGARFHVIGKKEVRKAEQNGLDLTAFEGLHVLCSNDGTVLTVYRNRRLDLRERRVHRLRRF